MADDVWRLDYQMDADADPEAVSRPEVVAERLRAQFGEDVDYELVWVGPYGYRSHVMERFREGPVFFVGDCAHGMSPFGARGGNSGIQDADNLVWKLDWLRRGWAESSILDTYDSERREGAEHNVLVTNRTARFLSPRSPAERMIRNAVIDLARRHPFARSLVNTGRMSVASTYTRSALAEAALRQPRGRRRRRRQAAAERGARRPRGPGVAGACPRGKTARDRARYRHRRRRRPGPGASGCARSPVSSPASAARGPAVGLAADRRRGRVGLQPRTGAGPRAGSDPGGQARPAQRRQHRPGRARLAARLLPRPGGRIARRSRPRRRGGAPSAAGERA